MNQALFRNFFQKKQAPLEKRSLEKRLYVVTKITPHSGRGKKPSLQDWRETFLQKSGIPNSL